MAKTGTGGGAATHSGTDYQNRCSAWFATSILAEQDASLPLGLPATETFESIQCEVIQPVDDLIVNIRSGGFVFGQAKHTMALQTTDDSEFASTLDQFVRQFLDARSLAPGAWPSARPLSPTSDRLVLLTSSMSSGPVIEALPAFLKRLRDTYKLHPGAAVDSFATNDGERNACTVVKTHVVRSWTKKAGVPPSEAELADFFALVHVFVLDVDADETDERSAKNLLRTAVLNDPTTADTAWSALVTACAGYASSRSGTGREGLQRVLLNRGIEVRTARSCREDLDRLRAQTAGTLSFEKRLAEIQIGPSTVKIDRPAAKELVAAALTSSILVVGEPGAGKSGALHDAANSLISAGHDLVFLAVDQIAAESISALRGELELEHGVLEILKSWPGTKPGFLVIDALDAARSEGAARTLRQLIEQVLKQGDRWRIIASIRKFDLRYSYELRGLFQGTPVSALADPEFSNVSHLNVPLLSDAELAQIPAQSQLLADVIGQAGSDLQGLLRVPFNLRLVGELLGEGVPTTELTPIRTQLELLDRYWRVRVIRSDGDGDARELVLRNGAEEMVKSRSLKTERSVVLAKNPAASKPLGQVLSSAVLIEWQPSPTAKADRYTLAFAHHLLFDYAVARLLLRIPDERIAAWLEAEPDLALAIRPSLVLHFRHLWNSDSKRLPFWQLVMLLQGSTRVSEVAKVVGPAVAAEMLGNDGDCSFLFEKLGATG